MTVEEDTFASPVPRAKHPCPSKIKHWQLRDLLHCPRYGELVHVFNNQVLKHDIASKTSTPLFDHLSFFPSSITAACGYAAAGGEKSELMIRKMDETWFASTQVGGSINNSLLVFEHSFGTRLYVSNNDQSIKVFSLPNLESVTTISLPTAVNYTAVSPDGTRMVAVGDTPEVFVFGISSSGEYHLISTLNASRDAGFCAAWSANSLQFAVASQDGVVSVWDIRKTEKLAKLSTKQQGARGAARCVKYSPVGAADLLAFSEVGWRKFDSSINYIHPLPHAIAPKLHPPRGRTDI